MDFEDKLPCPWTQLPLPEDSNLRRGCALGQGLISDGNVYYIHYTEADSPYNFIREMHQFLCLWVYITVLYNFQNSE